MDKTKCIMLIVRWCVDLARVIVWVLQSFKKEKMKNHIGNFPILTSTYVMGAQKKLLDETVILTTYNES